MNCEINNRDKWDEDVARRSPPAAKQPLTDAELEARRTALQNLARSSLAWRAFTYFMGCIACQAFWTALAVYALTRGVADPTACLLTAAAYSGAAVLVQAVPPVRPMQAAKPSAKGSCGSCGT